MDDSIENARLTMQAAAAKAPSAPEAFPPYLQAAIVYWRLQESASQNSGDMAAHLEAVTQRVECEDDFRRIVGRSFHTQTDAISLEDVNAL